MSTVQEKRNNYNYLVNRLVAPKDFNTQDAIGKAAFSYEYKKYGYLDNWRHTIQYIAKEKIPENKNFFNELILPGQYVKPYLDVEWYVHEYPDLNFFDVINDFIHAITTFFATEYNIMIKRKDIYIKECRRQTNNGFKNSFHLIVSPENSLVFKENTYVLFFVRKLKQLITYNPELIDESVYSRQRHLRMLGHCKNDQAGAPFKKGAKEEGIEVSPTLDIEKDVHYFVTYITPQFYILTVEEQPWGQNTVSTDNLDISDEQFEKLKNMVLKHHTTAYFLTKDANNFYQFNYTDRNEKCFWSGNLHEKIGFFAKVDLEGYITIGCHSARCVEVDSNQKQYRMKPIGNIHELSEDEKKRRAVSFTEKIFPSHALIEKEVYKKALGLSNIFEQIYLKPVNRIKWIDNGNTRSGVTYFWNGKIWEEDTHLFIHRLLSITLPKCLNSYIRSISGKDYAQSDSSSNSSDFVTEVSVNMNQENIVKLCKKLIDSLNTGNINSQIINFIRPLINDNDFAKIKDIHPNRMSVKNGMVDLKTKEVILAEPTDNITKTLDLPYLPDEYGETTDNYKIWDTFVQDITRSKTGELNYQVYNYLRWLIGYAIQGVPKKKLFVIMWGPEGYNGKSLLLNTLSAVLEDYAVTMDKNIILAGKAKTAGSHSTEFVRLENCRLGILSDTAEDCCIDDGQIKQLTSITDKISVREIYGKQKEMRPTLVPIVATNYKIRVNLNDLSMYERLVLIPFWIRFLDSPTEPHHRKNNPDLAEQFNDPEFKKSILCWIIDAGKYYNDNPNLKIPEELKQAKDAYRKNMNIFLEFLDEYFIVQNNKDTPLDVMKHSYYRVEEFLELFNNYCQQLGIRLKGVKIEKEFQKYLLKHKIDNINCFIGLIRKD